MSVGLRIAFLTSTNPLDKKAWSGIHFQMYTAIKSIEPDTVAIGPIWDKPPKAIIFLINKISWILFKKRYNRDQNLLLSLWYAFFIKLKLGNKKFDLIFAPTSSSQIAFFKTNIPIYCYGDTSFSQINGYYPEFSNLISYSNWESEYIEKRALKKAKVRIYASEWAATHAAKHYQLDNTYVVPFGANILNDVIPEFNPLKLEDPICRLLFLGVDWERKGGPIAYKTLLYLNAIGLNAELTVVGCQPPVIHPKMRVIPFLNKNISSDYQKFISIFSQSHFLLMPARAECAGIIYAEASAFYVPSLATETGGIGSLIENGVNGYKLDLAASAKDYAAIVKEYFLDKDRYCTFAFQSHEKYKNELNWKHWATQIMKIFGETLKG